MNQIRNLTNCWKQTEWQRGRYVLAGLRPKNNPCHSVPMKLRRAIESLPQALTNKPEVYQGHPFHWKISSSSRLRSWSEGSRLNSTEFARLWCGSALWPANELART